MVASSLKNNPQFDQALVKTLLDRVVQQVAQPKLEGDVALDWHYLKRAPFISRVFLALYFEAYVVMLRFEIDTRDVREVLGQLFRSLITPPSAIARKVSIGSKRRSRVPAFAQMDIPNDLKTAIDGVALEQHIGAMQ
jgi:hypothetical protein